MDFNNINMDIDFNCIEGNVTENLTDTFTRKIKSSTISSDDFKSYWEKDRRPKEKDHDSIRKFKGVSVNKINEFTNESYIANVYKITFALRPKSKINYCKFKLLPNAGKIWETPRVDIPDLSHCTFFKSDQFTLDSLEVLEVKQITL